MDRNDMDTNLPAKRKRCVLSYAEPVYDSDSEDCSAVVDDACEALEVGDEFGSRRKSKRQRTRFKKKAIAKCSNQPSKPFRFLDLPAELREEIYKMALAGPDTVSIVFRMKALRRTVVRGIVDQHPQNGYSPRGERTAKDVRTHIHLNPSLLAVNKQINSEASHHLYAQRFLLEDTRALYTFLTAIGPSNRALLSTIVLNGWSTGRGALKGMNATALASLASCVNLTKLQFNCIVGYTISPPLVAKQLYRDGHYFFEAYGCAKGKRDAAVDVIELEKWSDSYGPWPNCSHTAADVAKCKQEFRQELRRLLR